MTPAPYNLTITLKKGFTHYGHEYKAGDPFTCDEQGELENLVQQGYADDPNKPPSQQQGQPQS